jgi:hypothetical protein
MNDGPGALRGLRQMWSPRTGLAATVASVALLTAACSSPSAAAGSRGAPAAAGSASSAVGGSGGSSAAGRPATDQKQLAYSKCMRSHGVPGVPTALPSVVPGSAPSTSPHWGAAPVTGPNPGSPRWQAAQQACRSLMPAPALVAG